MYILLLALIVAGGCGSANSSGDGHDGSVDPSGQNGGLFPPQKASCDAAGGELVDCAFFYQHESPMFKCTDASFEWDDLRLECVVIEKSDLSAYELCGMTGGTRIQCGTQHSQECVDRSINNGTTYYNCSCPDQRTFDLDEGCGGELLIGQCNTDAYCESNKQRLCNATDGYGSICLQRPVECRYHVCAVK